MKVTINGEQHTINQSTISQLLENLKIDYKKVAVELNLEILPKDKYGITELNDGDKIEIVHFVGGG